MDSPRVHTKMSRLIRQGEAPEFFVPSQKSDSRNAAESKDASPQPSPLHRRKGVRKTIGEFSKRCQSIDEESKNFVDRVLRTPSPKLTRQYAYKKPEVDESDPNLLSIRCSAVNVPLHPTVFIGAEKEDVEGDVLERWVRRRSGNTITNCDLRSQAALGLKHLRDQTPFGFHTLSEQPEYHTRESYLQRYKSSPS